MPIKPIRPSPAAPTEHSPACGNFTPIGQLPLGKHPISLSISYSLIGTFDSYATGVKLALSLLRELFGLRVRTRDASAGITSVAAETKDAVDAKEAEMEEVEEALKGGAINIMK
ncbi:hypothetical protein MMC21_008214 [Puttea exsequens]|nr:hypothetical protein [Puttea exsequens]